MKSMNGKQRIMKLLEHYEDRDISHERIKALENSIEQEMTA